VAQTDSRLAVVTRDIQPWSATVSHDTALRRTTVTGDNGLRRTTISRESGSRRVTVSGDTDSRRANVTDDIGTRRTTLSRETLSRRATVCGDTDSQRSALSPGADPRPTAASEISNSWRTPPSGTGDIALIHRLELLREQLCSNMEWAQKAYEPVIQIKMGLLPDRYEEPTCALDLAVQSLSLSEVERVLSREDCDPDGDLLTGLTNTPPLVCAALLGSYEIVEALLCAKATVNYSLRRCSCSPIGAAIIGGNPAIVRLMLNAGADPDAVSYGETALQAAVGVGSLEILDLLLDAGADVNYLIISDRTVRGNHNAARTALQTAAAFPCVNSTLIVSRLLAAGADVNAGASSEFQKTALQFAASNGHLDMADILITYGADVNAVGDFGMRYSGEAACLLELAVNAGSLDVVKRLLDANARVPGYGPLQTAARDGDVQMVELLLGAGADPNADAAVSPPTSKRTSATALEAAIRRCSLPVVERLIASGADVKKPLRCIGHLMPGYGIYGGLSIPDPIDPKTRYGGISQGFSLLHVAVGVTWREGVKALLGAGADVNFGFSEGWLTPLGFAVYIEWLAGAEMLLASGTDPRISLAGLEVHDADAADRLLSKYTTSTS